MELKIVEIENINKELLDYKTKYDKLQDRNEELYAENMLLIDENKK